jgi:hypothetical protein
MGFVDRYFGWFVVLGVCAPFVIYGYMFHLQNEQQAVFYNEAMMSPDHSFYHRGLKYIMSDGGRRFRVDVVSGCDFLVPLHGRGMVHSPTCPNHHN